MKRSLTPVGEDSMLSSKTLKLDGAIASAITCPVCLGFFEEPVLLKCGHAICSSCENNVRTNDNGQKNCPECRGEYSKRDIVTNIPVRKILQSVRENDSGCRVGDECPHVGSFAECGENCAHCEKAFCPACMICHFEKIRMETKWLFSSFNPRLGKAVSSLESTAVIAKNVISEKIENARTKVKEETKEMIEELKQKEAEWLRLLDSYEEAEVAHVDCFVKDSQSVPVEVAGLADELNESIGVSVMLSSIENLVKLRESTHALNHKICAIEGFENACKMYKCTVDFKKLKSCLNEDVVVKSVNKIRKPPCSEKTAEFFRLKQALNSLESTKQFFEMRESVPRSMSKLIVNSKDEDGDTALNMACDDGNLDVVRYLVESCGANILQPDSMEKHDLPIHCACRNDNLEVVQYLIKRDPACVSVRNKYSESPLFAAIEAESVDIVKYLVEVQRVDVEEKGMADNTALLYAVEFGNLEKVKYLIQEAKADPSAYDADGKSIFDLALADNKAEMLAYLVSKFPTLLGQKNYESLILECFESAAYNGCLEAFKTMAEIHSAVLKEAVKNVGCEIMLHAAKGGDPEIGRILLEEYEAAADRFPGENTKAPIHVAIKHNHPAFVALLLKTSPQVKNMLSRKPPYETPMQMARRLGFKEIESMLNDTE